MFNKEGTLCIFVSATQKFKAFSYVINNLSGARTANFAVCGVTEKPACIFLCSSLIHVPKIRSCHTTWQSQHTIFSNLIISRRDITTSVRLRCTTSVTILTLWGHYYGKYGLSEYKHCDNAATNSNSENARSRMMASFRQGRRLRVASGATAPRPALEGAPRFRLMSLSSYILR